MTFWKSATGWNALVATARVERTPERALSLGTSALSLSTILRSFIQKYEVVKISRGRTNVLRAVPLTSFVSFLFFVLPTAKKSLIPLCSRLCRRLSNPILISIKERERERNKNLLKMRKNDSYSLHQLSCGMKYRLSAQKSVNNHPNAELHPSNTFFMYLPFGSALL